jgi:hypothetical protein
MKTKLARSGIPIEVQLSIAKLGVFQSGEWYGCALPVRWAGVMLNSASQSYAEVANTPIYDLCILANPANPRARE